MLSCSSTCVGRVAVLADETLGANSVHGVHETPFLLGCPWSFCNAQKNMHALKEAGKLALGMAAEFCGDKKYARNSFLPYCKNCSLHFSELVEMVISNGSCRTRNN
jgi:hypothetical protein